MLIKSVNRSPILTFWATISLFESEINILIVQLGIGAAATSGVVPIVLIKSIK